MPLSPANWLPRSGATMKLAAWSFVLIGILTIFLVVFYPPVLRIEICSENAGISSLYSQRPNGNFWNDQNPVKIGCQTLAFDLLDYRQPVLQWHLPAAPGAYLVRDTQIQLGWSRVEVSLDSLSARRQIESIVPVAEGVRITTTSNAANPELTLTLSRPRRIAALHWGISLGYAALLAVAVFAGIRLSKRNRNLRLQQILQRLVVFLQNESFRLGEFAALAAMSIALNLYSLANFSISIDDEMAAFRVEPGIWLGEGRWTTYLLERFVFPQPVIPYAHNLMFALSIALAYMLLARALNLPRDWRMFLTFPVFGAFPTWCFITAFYANLPSVSLGILLVSLAGFIFARTRSAGGRILWGWLGLQVILLTVAVGGYQSFLLMYLAIGVGVIFFDYITTEEESPGEFRMIASSLGQLGAASALGFAAYLVINSLARSLVTVNPSTYIESFWNFELLFTDPWYAVKGSLIPEMRAFYFGAEQKYGVSLSATGFIIVLSWLFISIRAWPAGWKKALISFSLWLGLLIMPFLLNLVSARELPTRSFFAIPFIIWLMSVLLLQSSRLSIKLFNALVVLALVAQITVAQGTYAATAYLTQHQDRMLAYDLFRRISDIDKGFAYNQAIFIDVYGTKRAELIYPNPYGGTMGASFFEFAWKHDDISRIINFMKLMGYAKIEAVEREQRLLLTPYFESMPAWPAPGSVRKINGIYLIKLSEIPDPLHAQFGK